VNTEDSRYTQGLLRLHKRDLGLEGVPDDLLTEMCEPLMEDGSSLREALIKVKAVERTP